jgi:hypothetical protein
MEQLKTRIWNAQNALLAKDLAHQNTLQQLEQTKQFQQRELVSLHEHNLIASAAELSKPSFHQEYESASTKIQQLKTTVMVCVLIVLVCWLICCCLYSFSDHF